MTEGKVATDPNVLRNKVKHTNNYKQMIVGWSGKHSGLPMGGPEFEPRWLRDAPGFTAPTSSTRDPSRVLAIPSEEMPLTLLIGGGLQVFPVLIPLVLLALYGGRTRVEAGLGLGASVVIVAVPKKNNYKFGCCNFSETRNGNIHTCSKNQDEPEGINCLYLCICLIFDALRDNKLKQDPGCDGFVTSAGICYWKKNLSMLRDAMDKALTDIKALMSA
ncbi:hypothetical protein LXL04_003238 [Taraxacum kok-saghyz]